MKVLSTAAAHFLVLIIQCASAYEILIVNPIGSRSLAYLANALGSALGDAGHNVTHINSFSNSSSHPNIKDVITGPRATELFDATNVFDAQVTTGNLMAWLTHLIETVGELMWTNPQIISLWERRNSFDAIVTIGAGNEIATPFLIDYNGPHISLCTAGIEYSAIANFGHWLPLSVIPQLLLPFDEYMTFFERAINPIFQFFILRMYYWKIYPISQNVLERFFPNMGPYDRLYFNSSLLLINGHFALDVAIPLLPNQIEIGTINAMKPQQLPKDLMDFIEGSGSNGTIYFNLGSFAKSKDMPIHHKQILLNVFSKLSPRVLWKYEGDDLDLPPNVMTREWLPQQDILGHPNVRVFMSHCGNLGTQEAKYHGVPILAMPIALDQHRNAARIARQGFGLQINWADLNEETLLESLNTLLKDSKYETRLKQVSRVLQDQKESPGERAVWWIEYMIRHKGAPHMNYPGKRLHFLQYIMADVIVFWSLVLYVLYQIFKFCFLFLIKKCFSTKTKLE